MIYLTEAASHAIKGFIEQNPSPVMGLRLKVENGGCSGLRYGMRLEQQRQEDDQLFRIAGVNILIDVASLPLLTGIQLDYVETLEGSGFTFDNPNATNGCHCGKSFCA